MNAEREPILRFAAPHDCVGESCTFCEWSNPQLEIPEEGAG